MPANCAECVRLSNESASLLWEYNAAQDSLSLTPRIDSAYADRWTALASVSERLHEAQRREHLHQVSHHTPDVITKRRPDRRLSLVSDRRRLARGGRRSTDQGWSPTPPIVACVRCSTGTASLLEASTDARYMATYICHDCGHQFDRSDGV